MLYTHNLKIILVDKQNNIITNTDDFFLASVKAKFTKNIIHPIEWNGKKENISWEIYLLVRFMKWIVF